MINGCYYYFYACQKKYVLTLIDGDYHMLKLDESKRDLDIKAIRRIEELLPIIWLPNEDFGGKNKR